MVSVSAAAEAALLDKRHARKRLRCSSARQSTEGAAMQAQSLLRQRQAQAQVPSTPPAKQAACDSASASFGGARGTESLVEKTSDAAEWAWKSRAAGAVAASALAPESAAAGAMALSKAGCEAADALQQCEAWHGAATKAQSMICRRQVQAHVSGMRSARQAARCIIMIHQASSEVARPPPCPKAMAGVHAASASARRRRRCRAV